MKGQSEHTPIKQQKLAGMISVWEQVARRVKWFRPAIYDMTAGDGEPDIYGEAMPSPVQLWEMSKRLGCPFVAIENDSEKVSRLVDHIGAESVICGGWEDSLQWAEYDNAKHRGTNGGLAYLDPNGTFDTHALMEIFRLPTFRNVDLLLNVAATAFKRQRHGNELHHFITAFPKTAKVVRQSIGRYQWTMLYLSNGPAISWHKEGWHEANSAGGESIINAAVMTGPELERHDQRQLQLV